MNEIQSKNYLLILFVVVLSNSLSLITICDIFFYFLSCKHAFEISFFNVDSTFSICNSLILS